MPDVLNRALLITVVLSFAASAQNPNHITDPFATGWVLVDTNGDGIADAVRGHIVVPPQPTAAENAAAANIAARLGYGSTGLTMPLVITADQDRGEGPRIWVGKRAVRGEVPNEPTLEKDEGGIFVIGDNVAVIGDDAGIEYAAAAYAARAPYQWKVPGNKLEALGAVTGLTYKKGQPGLYRVFGGQVPASPAAEGPAAPAAAANASGPADENTRRLDLANIYTSRGLFRGTTRMPMPSTLDSHLYVPSGAAGVAMANLAARMGMEGIGISLPIASSADNAAAGDVRAQAVITGDTPLGQSAERKLRAEDTAATQSEPALGAGEGELRIVNNAFRRKAGILVRGDEPGAAAALDFASGHLPNINEVGKQYLALDEIRYDLHRFFSLRSGVAQSAMALHYLDQWSGELHDAKDVKAEAYVDVADPKLTAFTRDMLKQRFNGANVEVKTGSLRAGTQCCNDKDITLHYNAPDYQFHQAAPTFKEDVVIPWEGKRLIQAVTAAKSKIESGAAVDLVARVSEGPEERRKLQNQIREIVKSAGADLAKSHVVVLSAYKQGYSWLMDDIATQLAGRPVASIKIEFAKNIDATHMRAMYSPARWVHELYPVDEMLAHKLNLPLEKITMDEFEPPANGGGPTYRVHAYNAGGQEILTKEFAVSTVTQPYNQTMPVYEQVQVDTGWVRLDSGSKTILNERIKTDIEQFWDHYQTKTLPKVYQFVMAQVHGELKPEFAPPFDTLKIDIHMSEPDYDLDLDRERISSLEALQEDTFYTTDNFINSIGDLLTGKPINYIGRVIPIVHRSEDGQDGRVHIEFYGKPAANPLVRLSWTDAQGKRHTKERNLPAITGDMQPRLIQAKVKAGEPGVESLTWLIPADYDRDQYEDWLKLEGQDQVDRTLFVVERAEGQLRWLERMHAAGLYRDEMAYPHIKKMAMEFELPLGEHDKVDTPPQRKFVSWTIVGPEHARPMIADYADPKISGSPFVQWHDAISPAENAAILAKLATYPGVNVYWMGRSYLGINLWAADVMLPSPSVLHSWAKEETLKPSIVYSGRQHANEVSSTSHIDRLGEMLVTDPATRESLKKVNVVLHPITNTDGAQMSIDLARITPENMLHPGYHGSLSADVSLGQSETDPVYPESRTRKQLIDTWMPDAFLNPHGYPSHEWVQPFSEYTGWVQNRQAANTGSAWWIPRGWFTSLNYLRDPDHPYSKMVTYAIRDRIVEAERNVPGLLPLEDRMNARYERFGQRWQPRDMFQPIVNGIRIYMALKANPVRTGEAARSAMSATGGVNPDLTWDSAYTEAPDETAHGDYMKLVASAGLAFDMVHLNYLAEGQTRVTRTERDTPSGVQWTISRPRPVLPPSAQAPTETSGQN